ncbi:hypothetical protein [Geitlerinema calcuttense]|uniref:Uncharacterized protein n=1 Tax=Geitlerinema calcuttense NRMC-F 0142 TaxID=2922238 RepID=A0ABT7LV20_9CYAN|nr:hypothetical protein [Geitlerinema calcuttense]MDL5055886.1 hypothetical protein [Geitlerinema calcuttense NRMC-F 0142]
MNNEEQKAPELYLIETSVLQRMIDVLQTLPYNTVCNLIPDVIASAKPYDPPKITPEEVEP